MAAGVCAKDETFRLHFADLGAGEERLMRAKIAGDIEFEGVTELVYEGFGGLLVGEQPGGESGE